jgi:hypothetical protein
MLSGIAGLEWKCVKMKVNACRYYYLEPKNSVYWHPNFAQRVEKMALCLLRKL